MSNRKGRRRGPPQSRRPVARFAEGGLVPKPDETPISRAPLIKPVDIPFGGMRSLYKKAPRRVRFWRWLGFGEKHAARPNTPEFADYAEGWQIVASIWLVDWKDRFRVLISGRIMCHTAIKTFPAVERFTNTAAFSVLSPGYTPGLPNRTITRDELKRAAEAAKGSK